jgi:hypothetical protein
VEPAPASLNPGTLVRMAPLALYAQFPSRRFRHDGRRDHAVTLAVPQPLTRYLAALVGIPMCCVIRDRKEGSIGMLDACMDILCRTTMTLPSLFPY